MAKLELPKLTSRVRFPSPAPWTGILAFSQDPIFISGDEEKHLFDLLEIFERFGGIP